MTAATKETNLDGLEFDGNTVLCRVCGDKASGFHYGVHACEGCKGFFRRSIQQKIQYRPCLKNQQCNIMRVNRNRCQYCRLKKCISVGMSRDAVRFGRVPKREKAKIMEQMQKVNAVSQISMLNTVIESEKDFLQKIIDAHMRTCQFTRAKFAAFFEKAWQNPSFVNCPPHMACPLNPSPDCSDGIQKWEEFSDCFTPAIRNVVNFAKCIPGFHVFSQEDQVTLLKAGTFEVLLVHLACLFDAKSNTMLFASGQLYKRVSMTVTNSAGFLLDSMFDYADRFNELQLTDEEMALFSALVVIAADRPGLRYVEQIERVQNIITQGLQRLMKANHPNDSSVFAKLLMKIPDLRTLNTLHSEKLLGLTLPNSSDPQQREAVLGLTDNHFSHRFGAQCPVSFIAGKPEFAGKSEFASKLEFAGKPEFAGTPEFAGKPEFASTPEFCGKPEFSGKPEFCGKPEFAVPLSAAPLVKLEGSPIIPHHVKVSKTEEEIILQTPFGTFHRFPQLADTDGKDKKPSSEGGGKTERKNASWCPGSSGTSDKRNSPDPLEMDMPPSSQSESGMPKLSPAVSPQKECVVKVVTGERRHSYEKTCPELAYRRYPDGVESMDCSEHKVPKMWDYDMRSSRSNSLSSNSSLESQDSAYRTISNPSTPRSGIYEARSPYNLNDFHSRHLNSHSLISGKENGVEVYVTRSDGMRAVPPHITNHSAKYLHHCIPSTMMINPRLSAILEHHQSDGQSSKDSSRCSSPAESRGLLTDPHNLPQRMNKYGYSREGGGSPDGKKSMYHRASPYPASLGSDGTRKPASPTSHPRPPGPQAPASCPNGDCSPASRHPELLSRLQSVAHSSPSPSLVTVSSTAQPSVPSTDTTETHQNAMSTLKDKILRRIDSQENLVVSRISQQERGEAVTNERWEGDQQGRELERRGSPQDTGIPHPAYMPFPFPPASMHPAIMYQYNQLAAMQQFHALQHLQAQQAVQSQLQGAKGSLAGERVQRPLQDYTVRGEPTIGGSSSQLAGDKTQMSPVQVKCEPT